MPCDGFERSRDERIGDRRIDERRRSRQRPHASIRRILGENVGDPFHPDVRACAERLGRRRGETGRRERRANRVDVGRVNLRR